MSASAPPPATEALSREQLDSLARELEALYEQVPSTCCANSGECCELTEEEMEEGYATMFPLYRAEYAHIVDHVRSTFPEERQRELLTFTEERPRRCPFLGPDRGCTIYAVRPLICRTYAVMNPDTIREAAQRHGGEVPEEWIRRFVRREGGMLCPRVTVMQPEKLIRHARNLVTGAYEHALSRLSHRLPLVTREREKLIRPLIRRRSWPLRWTWGGYNALTLTPLEWVRSKLKTYWRRAQLNDLDS